jgi:hypothetical protein
MTLEAKDVASVCWVLWLAVAFLRWRQGQYVYHCRSDVVDPAVAPIGLQRDARND